MRLALAWLHLLALAIGMGAVWARGHALRDLARAAGPATPEAPAALRVVFLADAFWGLAAALWLVTGLGRAFGPFEKGAAYYFANHAFLGKMGLFVVILALEMWPMITFIRWRKQLRRESPIDLAPARALARVSALQAVLVAVMVLLASAMARGYGSPP